MAVLIEGISVVIRLARLEAKLPDGFRALARRAPNQTLCADGELARVGFMSPDDVRAFCGRLSGWGLVFAAEDPDGDFAVVDQQRGPTSAVPWLDFGHVDLAGAEGRVAACQLRGSSSKTLATPDGWTYEDSLSKSFGFAPTGDKSRYRFLRRERGLEVYLDLQTNREVFTGRTEDGQP